MHRRFATICLLAIVAASCREDGKEDPGLRLSTRRQFDPKKLEQVDELLSALSQPGGGLDGQLGARRQVITSSISVTPRDRRPELLEERFVIDLDGRGAVHAVHDSGLKDGLEAIFVGDALYIRPRFGKFVRRRPDRDEIERLRMLVEGVPADFVELLAPFLAIREVEGGRLLGRPTRRLMLSKGVSAPLRETEPRRKWRETLRVQSLDGALELDAASGAPLALRLEARYQFDRPAGPSPVEVRSSLQLVTGAPEAVMTPSDFVERPQRSRPMLDRNFLLGGRQAR